MANSIRDRGSKVNRVLHPLVDAHIVQHPLLDAFVAHADAAAPPRHYPRGP